jgi:hypothetical protein
MVWSAAGLCLPMLDELAELRVALEASSKSSQLHPFGCAVSVKAGGLLDGPAPLGEGPLHALRCRAVYA